MASRPTPQHSGLALASCITDTSSMSVSKDQAEKQVGDESVQLPLPVRVSPPIVHFDAGLATSASPVAAAAELRLPTPTPRADSRVYAAQPVLDARSRVGLVRLTTVLGWDVDRPIAYQLRSGCLLLTAGDSTDPRTLRLDANRRLTLPPAACYALGAHAGDQLQALADLRSGELVLISLVRALETLLPDRSHARE